MTWTSQLAKPSIVFPWLTPTFRILAPAAFSGPTHISEAGPGGTDGTRPQDIYKKAFGPRIGFAYSINDKTVLRGGYGIFYEPLKEGSFADQDGLGFFNRADDYANQRRPHPN